MYGINGQPLIETDRFIDAGQLSRLKDEMDAGLARCEWEIGSFGPGVYEKRLDRDQYHLEEVVLPRGDSPEAEQARKVLETLPTLTQKRRYLKLRYGLYNSSYSVYLRKPVGHDYSYISQADRCEWTDAARFFPRLLRWIDALPFVEVGRILFFVNEHLCPVVAHSDLKHSRENRGYVADNPHEHEFVWIRPTIDDGKSFFVLDETTGVRHYVKGRSCWFNSFDVHGADPSPAMTYSLRIDGVFTERFRCELGVARAVGGPRPQRRPAPMTAQREGG